MPETIEAQAEACWRNITAILAEAGMNVGDLVKITTSTSCASCGDAGGRAGAARAKHFGDARPGSATIIVKALVNPDLAHRDRGGGGWRFPAHADRFRAPGENRA